MKAYRLLILAVIGLGSITTSQAQIFDKIKDRVEEEAEKAIDGKLNKNQNDKSRINRNSTFIAGDSLVYTSNFERNATGAMPNSWNSTGSGSIVKLSRFPGKWLEMSQRTSYKLKENIDYPDRFSIEFDLIAAADKVRDLSGLFFGFTKDNSLSRWISSDNIWSVQLQYMNKKKYILKSQPRDLYQPGEFDLEVYANQKMHVSIAVNGDQVQVYLDGTKIADAQLFRGEKFKHFYISSPLKSKNNASVLFGNFRINTFK